MYAFSEEANAVNLFVCMCLCVCISVHVCACVSVHVCVYMCGTHAVVNMSILLWCDTIFSTFPVPI